MSGIKIKELDERAHEICRNRDELRDRRERAVQRAAAAQKTLASVQKSLNSWQEDGSVQERERFVSRQQELQSALRDAVREMEECDRRIEGLEDEANETIMQAERHIRQSNAQIGKTYEAQASSPYGRSSIAILAQVIADQKDRAQQIVALLSGTRSNTQGLQIGSPTGADAYLRGYRDLINAAAFGLIEGVEGEPTCEERRNNVMFVNDVYVSEIVAVGMNVQGFTTGDARQALQVLKATYNSTGAPIQDDSGALPSLAESQATLRECSARISACVQEGEEGGWQKSIGQHSLYLVKGSSGQAGIEIDQAGLAAAYGDAAGSLLEILGNPEADAEALEEADREFARCHEAFCRYYDMNADDGLDRSRIASALGFHHAYDRMVDKGLPLTYNALVNCLAETRCIDAGGAKNVDFSEFDHRVSLDFADALHDAKTDFPDLDIVNAGTIEQQVGNIRTTLESFFETSLRKTNPGFSDEVYRELASRNGELELHSMRLDITEGILARSLDPRTIPRRDAIEPYRGVGVARKYASDYGAFDAELKRLPPRSHPPFCDTPRSTIDHELGHEIDRLLGAHDDPTIVELYKGMLFREGSSNELSQYAATNIQEFIAEAYSEYRNNPYPRSLSQAVCERLFDLRDARKRL